jgi:sulfate-transporting ATPase
VAGLIVVSQLIGAPDGAVAGVAHRFGALRKKRRTEGEAEAPGAAERERSHDVDVSPAQPTHEPAVLAVEGLRVAYGPVVAVDGLDLTVGPGEIVGLIGPNGAGKTTALDAISGFVAMAEGSIALGGTDLAPLPVHRRARAGLARTFQTVEPFNDLSVAENLAVATDHLGANGWALAFVRVPKPRFTSSTWSVVESFDLERDLCAYPPELPQGRRRLLGVARALASTPAVLLLDEPAAGLNARETEQLGRLLRRVADDSNVGMLLVEHDMSLVTSICDSVVALDFGRTIFSGDTHRVMLDESVRLAYLGEEVRVDQGGLAPETVESV